ncbi:MAG: ketoacyl-ACP synthase III [Bacteroidales bacterium]|nr:ketoacyl-ACP synthase III [Bacteroidales bacterium]MCD8394965.1 ketoacyl-ACP synthase III [Bacteroidales bacterium]
MATIRYKGVGIRAVAACVPREVVHNKDLGYLIPEEEIEKTINSIGIHERRIADADTCASDLCYKAAVKLMEDNGIAPESIDMILFMSQTSDYRIPATAPILQHRLGCPKTTAALDLSLGCSGYVFALSTAMAYASIDGINRVLLLDGETFSKIVSRNDKVDWPLYGDAGTATLVEKGDFGETVFSLYSDGEGEDAVKIKDGMRNAITAESLVEKEVEPGVKLTGLDVFMDGMDVFNFAMSVVPKGIKNLCKELELPLESVDYLIFHQANKFMTDFFAKRLKFPLEKVPYCLQKYGNTSSASVPLTISSELADKELEGKTAIMAGFGAGLSWGFVKYDFKGCKVSPVIEY